jgi:hypothetical protein
VKDIDLASAPASEPADFRRRAALAKLGLAATVAYSAPLIATWLFAQYHSGYAIAIYIAACAVVSLASASFMPDYTGKDIAREYDEGA